MAKQAGLGDRLFVDGVDLSGDTGSLSAVGGGPSPLEVTGINREAFERLGGVLSGRIDWSAWWNPAGAHPELSALPIANRTVTYCRGTALGSPAASMLAKQINYDPTRAQDGSLTVAVQSLSTEWPLEWGQLLTAGIAETTSAGAQAGLDYGATPGSTDFGLQAYLHVFAFTGTSATVTIQDSANGSDWTDLTDGAFAAATAVGSQRIQIARDATVRQHLRVNVAGTFSDFDFAVVATKNLSTVDV